MQFEGARIEEQGQVFQIIIVNRSVITNASKARETISYLKQTLFPNIPVILMAQDSTGRATYYGRPDIARFMSKVSLRRIPWKKYTVN